MVLNNMQSLLNALTICGGSIGGDAYLTQFKSVVSLKTTEGNGVGNLSTETIFTPLRYITNAIVTAQTQTSTWTGGKTTRVGFGSGNTPVTAEDYKLENLITAGLTLTVTQTDSFSTSNGRKTGTYTKVATLTITNSQTEGDITIGEIGFYGSYYYNSSDRRLILLHREVLDTPVTLSPSETKAITFTFTMENSVA